MNSQAGDLPKISASAQRALDNKEKTTRAHLDNTHSEDGDLPSTLQLGFILLIFPLAVWRFRFERG